MTKVPTGRLQRLASLARVGARAGASMLVSQDGDAAANQAAEVLGSLRGLAAKIGQMASYIDGLVPDAHHDTFEQALRGLRDSAPASPPEKVHALVEAELGAPLSKLFTEWEPAPFASASIGQVHRARLHDGREVAVKVQHPGVQEAIEADLRNGKVLQRMVHAFVPPNFNAREVFEEISQRFREELDYTLEAERQRQFAAFHAGYPGVHIPKVVPTRSGRRVLTSELVSGMSLEQAAQQPPEIRVRYAETLWHFAYKTTLVDGLFNADPHPGNYLFNEDGSVNFIDFGCVQLLTASTLRSSRAAHIAAVRRDEPAFRRAAVQVGQTRGGAYEDAFTGYLHRCLRPVFESPYRITRPFVSQLVGGLYELKNEAFTRGSQIVPLPPSTALLNRLQFGFMSVVARLDAEVDYAAVERRFFEDANLM